MHLKRQTSGDFAVTLSLDAGNVILSNSSIKELYFIEDIFSFCIKGKLTFTDERGIFELGPITGNEKLTIYYGQEEDIEREFYIYKLSQVDQHTNATVGERQIIELFFVDPSFYLLTYYQYSKSWVNTKISDIIKDIYSNMININKWKLFEQTNEILDNFYMPYWTPSTTIKWLLQRSTGKLSSSAGYCIYNNSQGTNLTTLDTLFNAKVEDKDNYYFSNDDLFYPNKILHWSISGIDSLSLKKLSGGTLYGYDSMKKSFLTKTFTYNESVKNHTILGQKTLFPDYSDSKLLYKNIEESTLENINTIYHSSWNKTYDHQQVLKIVVEGNERRSCGNLIKIVWPSKDKQNQIYNMNLSGFYLVKSIIHYYTSYQKPTYKQKLLCIKNGFEDSNARNLVKSTKKRIDS